MKSVTNPLCLNIGDKVRVKATSEVDYDGDGNRVVFNDDFKEPQELMVVGVKRKGLGKYVKGGLSGPFEEDDYKCSELTISHYVWFYECRKDIKSKIVLVSAEDIIEEETVTISRTEYNELIAAHSSLLNSH